MSKRKSTGIAAVKDDEKKPKLDSFVATRRQSARRSTAKAQELIKKQAAADSEDEELSLSDSDDEFVIPTGGKDERSNGLVVQPVNSFLSSESADSSEDENKGAKLKVNHRKIKTIKPKTEPLAKKSSRSVLSSDSEEDFEEVVAPASPKKTTKSKILAEVSTLTDSESDLEDVPTQNLQELFPLLAKQEELKAMEKKVKEDGDKKLKKSKVQTLDVSQLLAMGETQEPVPSTSKSETKSKKSAKTNKKLKVDSDESDWEEVEHGPEQTIPKEGVEVKIETTNGLKRKKTKTMDLEAIIKRRINQIRREKQVELHKASLLCHLSHGMVVSKQLNSPSLMAVALSILPSQHCYPPKKSDLNYLEKIASWFHKKVSVADVKDDPDKTLVQLLELAFQVMKAPNKRILVLMFVTLMRSLGLKTRLIISLQPLPLKPKPQDLLTVLPKPEVKLGDKKKQSIEAKKTNEKTSKANEKAPKKSKKEVKSKSGPPKSKRSKKERESKYFSSDKSESSPDVSQKLKSLRARKNKKYEEELTEESESDDHMPKTTKGKRKAKVGHNDEEDFKPQVLKVVKNSRIAVKDRRVLSSESETPNSPKPSKMGNDFWVEVFAEMEEKWISIDVITGKVHCVEHLHSKATSPVLYVMGFNQNNAIRDLTRRYCPQYHTSTRKNRVDQEWWEEAIVPFYGKKTAVDKEEEEELEKQLQDRPVPKTLSELKNHPLYVLKRHLLKYEAIYPPDAPPLGFFKDEPIYARECVFILRSRETWVKEAKVVKPKQEPYKVVKSRPKYDRMSGQMLESQPLEIFGPWQTEDYVPPAAEDGKVPRNEYGNVELFKPCMLPKGTVHLKLSNLNRIAKKLGIDCAPAMTGFDFHCGGSHPVFEGFVVCEEFKDMLIDAHRQEEEEREKRGEEKRLKRIYGNWRKLVRGLMIRENLMKKYDFGQEAAEEKKKSKSSKKAVASTSKVPLKQKQPSKRKKDSDDETSDSS